MARLFPQVHTGELATFAAAGRYEERAGCPARGNFLFSFEES
jgi:hypothetical protein